VPQVAVLLLDTQGTFDNVTTMQESTAIVAISALISSVTIFNMSERIESKDLDNLRVNMQLKSAVRARVFGFNVCCSETTNANVVKVAIKSGN
jgi:hypothetical protein